MFKELLWRNNVREGKNDTGEICYTHKSGLKQCVDYEVAKPIPDSSTSTGASLFPQ